MEWLALVDAVPGRRSREARRLEVVFDQRLRATYGFDLTALRARWIAALEAELAEPSVAVPEEDRAAIARMLALRDDALTRGDALLYRALMEGFYCDRTSDSARAKRAHKMTAQRRPGTSTLVHLVDLGIKNYRYAYVVFDRSWNGGTRRIEATLERFPVGWRFLGATDEE